MTLRKHLVKGMQRGLCLASRPATAAGTRVLAYHSVDESGSPLSVHPQTFRSHLAWLRDCGFETLTSSEFARRRMRASANDKNVLITFDDGFQELYQHAFPLLREFSYTAVIFVVTDHVAQEATWIERDMADITARIVPELRLQHVEADRHVEQLQCFGRRKLLSWDEIAEMHNYGIDFQSHSCTHPFFSNLDPPSLRRELADSKAELETRLHKTVECIAYPYGDYHHHDLKTALRETGYTQAFCDSWTPVRDKADHSYEVNRIPIGENADAAYLRLCFSAGFAWYRSLASLGKRLA